MQDFNFRFIIHPGGIPQHMRFSLASTLPERFHRHEAWAAELLRQEPMPHLSHRPPLALGAPALARRALWLLAAFLTLSACEKNHPAQPAAAPVAAMPAPVTVSPLARQLAAARLEVANTCIEKNAQDEALALLVSACKADPTYAAASSLMRQLFAQTVWNIPVTAFHHQLPVEQLAFVAPASLWVSLAETTPDGFNTTVLWNSEALKIDSILFPVCGATTRSLVVAQTPRSLVIQRGSGASAVTLLCAADTLRPICDLGPLPPNLTPQSVVVSSRNGLLIAHPGPASASDSQLVWRIRDAATGEVVSSSEPRAAAAARPLAAQLDSQRLRILHADGSLLELPVSPVKPARNCPAAVPLVLSHAQFSPDGASVFALVDQGPDQSPCHRIYQISDVPDTLDPQIGAATGSLIPDRASMPGWVVDLPWSSQGTVWSGLLRDHGNPDEPPPIRIQGNDLRFVGNHRVPIHSESPITAVAFGPDLAIIGGANGNVVMHRFLPLPAASTDMPAAEPIDITRLGVLAEILSGLRFNETTSSFLRLSAQQRFALLETLRDQQVASVLPGLDFTATLDSLKTLTLREPPAAAMMPLWDRLIRADASARAWPRLLELARPLADTRWHQDLTEEAACRATPRSSATTAQVAPSADPPPWQASLRLRDAFERRDGAAILRGIEAAGSHGTAAASALELALDSDTPEWIEASLSAADGLPPLLRTLGLSRIAWLQNRRADAISLWPDEFPSFENSRLTQDWDGWEQGDFAPCYRAHLLVLRHELAAYELAAGATAAERAAVAQRLLDPAARSIIGRRRLAENALGTALALADFPENSAATCQLAGLARALGAQPVPCLRAEALALTRLGDYKNAHPRWVTLLTEHPVASHLSNDYAEAAYTAFEITEPAQAVEILGTGINHFPNDSGFAMRAGWIALLTNNATRAYQFLLAGLRVGYPADKRENATLLLAVAAAQAGFPEDAATHFENLLELAPLWAQDATIEALEWPDELKASLRELAQSQ